MDSIYIVNTCATVIYGFIFGMSLIWWIEYYLKKEPQLYFKNKSEMKREIKKLKSRLHMLKTKLIILEHDQNKSVLEKANNN